MSSHLLSQTDILPLVMNDACEVSLDPHPTQSMLPISPIFIEADESSIESQHRQTKKSLQDLMPADLAAVEATVNEVQDLDAFLAMQVENHDDDDDDDDAVREPIPDSAEQETDQVS